MSLSWHFIIMFVLVSWAHSVSQSVSEFSNSANDTDKVTIWDIRLPLCMVLLLNTLDTSSCGSGARANPKWQMEAYKTVCYTSEKWSTLRWYSTDFNVFKRAAKALLVPLPDIQKPPSWDTRSCIIGRKKINSRILESSEKVLEPCGAAGNNLRVIYNQLAENETKKDFAVCVKGLDTFGIDHLFCIDCHI